MAKKNGTRTRAEAKKLMWEYYRDNKASLPKWIGEYREEILCRLINGTCVAESFSINMENICWYTLGHYLVEEPGIDHRTG